MAFVDDAAGAEGAGKDGKQVLGGVFGQGDEEAAGGLGVVEKIVEFGDAFDAGLDEFAVVFGAAGDGAGAGVGESAGEELDRGGVDFEGDVAGERHFAGVAEEAEAGYVGTGAGAGFEHTFAGNVIEPEHGVLGGLRVFGAGDAAFDGGGDDAGAQRFGEDERVAGERAGVGEDARGVDRAGDGVAELDVFFVDGVAADQGAAGFVDFFGAAAENLFEDGEVAGSGVGEDGEGGERARAHGVDVAQGVGGGDGAEGVGIVDDGGEEVDGLHEGTLRRELVHARIVGRLKPYEDVIVLPSRQARQSFVQNLWTKLCRSTGRFGALGEFDHRLSG